MTSPAQHLWQTTLRRSATLCGVGAHSGVETRITLLPADADSGVSFCPANSDVPLPALWPHVRDNRLRVEIAEGSGRVSTIEHLMAALHGLGVDNALIEIDGPEAPAMDGSALPFVTAIREAGLRRLAAPRRVLKVARKLRVAAGDAFAEFSPLAAARLELDVEIDFPTPVGRQRAKYGLDPKTFAREIAPARTFGCVEDAERLWRQGLALGASFENSVIFDRERVLNPGGLRFQNEMARHKMLDVLGDLALAGAPIHGAFRSHRGGHALNLALVERLMTTPGAYDIVEARRLAGARESVETTGEIRRSP